MIKNISKRKLNRGASHRVATLRNLATNLIKYGMIRTTDAKAKELKRYIQHLISRIKKTEPEFNKYRVANMFLSTKDASEKLIKVIIPRYNEINSGYVKTAILGNRKGDNAKIVAIKFK